MSGARGAKIKGAGIGLRAEHYREILASRPPVPWFEALSENYFGAGGPPLRHLAAVREHYPLTLHGVGMSLGSTDPLDRDYLDRLKALARHIEPARISDHVAWISVDGDYVHDLLPLPCTEEALRHVAERVTAVQEHLGTRILVENPSTYLEFEGADMSEAEFMAALASAADCDLLLDVNNLHVNAVNHGIDARGYIDMLPATRVREIHLAGYEQRDGFLYDTHGHAVWPPVWELYEYAVDRLGAVPTLVEWDTDIPPLATLREEAARAQAILDARG